MVKENHLDPLEDNRFKEIKRLKKKHLPHQLHWYLKEDYFSEELLGVYSSEVSHFRQITSKAYALFEEATTHMLQRNELDYLGIPYFFEACIHHSWEHRKKHPFLYGRFDINGGFNNTRAKIIEFNADTCSTLPETLLWQPLQLEHLGKNYQAYNTLATDIERILTTIKRGIPAEKPHFLASTFGYQEDVTNVNCIADIAYTSGYQPSCCKLEEVTFSEEEGIFYNLQNEYQPISVWFKMIPWDWMFHEEPELAKIVSTIIQKELAVILNPAYTAIWQNKKFLAYITKHFPNDIIAPTYTTEPTAHYVSKPIYGRLGENIVIQNETKKQSKGDYGDQNRVYQHYVPLVKDLEEYSYQTGMFHTHHPSALNFRTQESTIITDDCEFMSHFIL